jgi:hypothetical protein
MPIFWTVSPPRLSSHNVTSLFTPCKSPSAHVDGAWWLRALAEQSSSQATPFPCAFLTLSPYSFGTKLRDHSSTSPPSPLKRGNSPPPLRLHNSFLARLFWQLTLTLCNSYLCIAMPPTAGLRHAAISSPASSPYLVRCEFKELPMNSSSTTLWRPSP